MLPKPDENTEFVLKHRIVGAAFLLFFGALFLPWLLGAPSEASKLPSATSSIATPDLSSGDIENELLKAIENEQVADVEKVYISKITPLDSDKSKEESEKPPKPKVVKTAPAVKPKPAIQEKPSSVGQPVSKAGKTPKATVQQASEDTQSKPNTNKVEVGWIVQVGMFTDKKGAARVVKDLKQKGFDPSTTIVDTNRGKGTGTRVWLGPYAQRVDAAKAKNRLSGKTGVAGFIRAYP